MNPDEQAEPYAVVASQVGPHVRGDEPEDLHRWLYEAMRAVAAAKGRAGDMPTVTDWMSVIIALGVAVPPDDDWAVLTEWRHSPRLKPHGTMAALRRHQYHHERTCSWCRAYEAGFKAGRYQAAKGEEAA